MPVRSKGTDDAMRRTDLDIWIDTLSPREDMKWEVFPIDKKKAHKIYNDMYL